MTKNTNPNDIGTIDVTEFFHNDYVNYSSYDNLRKIGSLVDGQKNAARKVLYTVIEKNIRAKIKVSQLGSKVAEFAEYLHGNMDGVIVNLAQDFIGTNNIPLLTKSGNFGTRFSPDASASRYIFTLGSDELFKLFNKEDIPILEKQYFEGMQIEPKFYVPSLPILLINGSEGVSSGFAQKILPRDPIKIKQYLTAILSGKTSRYKFEPFYNGFKGTIEQGENSSQWLIKGVVEKIGATKVRISEVPIGYSLRTYLKVLDDLEDKKVINSYRDKAEDDNFLFEVSINAKILSEMTNEDLLDKLKLIKKVSENYTVLDENNKIVEYNSVQEIIDHYVKVKLHYLELRKANTLKSIAEAIAYDESKYNFIDLVTSEKLKINKRTKDDIVKDLEKFSNIITKDDSYDYLLGMPIYSLTKERMEKLQMQIKEGKQKMKDLNAKSVQTLWMEEI